ncbi:sensor histidine kinase [Mucilaginibacter sp. FT3.2]|uniref:sensor histidine kinase n=1 Tax=Mucilaginibacter sp. FT3.2 TaxID=2723090 RepID=UPI00161097E7|nr:sensor histidine kinase [Mucilaginibacter sp. FT3.2]MBB6230702.1 hypothetical protein [Mucilaginibacter sp. FT3.2]
MSRFKAFSVVIHIAGWLLFMAFPLVFLNGRNQDSSTSLILQQPTYWLFCLTYIFLFYINAYLFIPKLFLRKKYVVYAIAILILLTGLLFLRPFERLLHSTDGRPDFRVENKLKELNQPLTDNNRLNTPPYFRRHHRHRPFLDINSLFIFLMIVALSTAIKTIQQLQLSEQRMVRAEADKAGAELSSLKAQINPHFLFNTLNNIYTLIVTHDDNAADSIMKLSNIMRYVTDEVGTNFVSLQNEFDCISDYIDLQRIRLGENTLVEFESTGNINGKKIAPLVLMPFVENVFKYGISNHEKSVISIRLDVNEKDIAFLCSNRIFNNRNGNQNTGMGIQNTKQRLAHLYPGSHVLNINEHNGYYTVKLTLQI